jgi:hypothetical protein
MEISDVRRRVTETVERAKRSAGERRVRSDEAARDYATFLDSLAVPLVRQVANVLKVHGYLFGVFTPSGSVRLASEKSADEYIEIALDTSGEQPVVLGHSRRARGGHIVENERPIGGPAIGSVTEEQVLTFLLEQLEPLVER